jgi:hypothetical protein
MDEGGHCGLVLGCLDLDIAAVLVQKPNRLSLEYERYRLSAHLPGPELSWLGLVAQWIRLSYWRLLTMPPRGR